MLNGVVSGASTGVGGGISAVIAAKADFQTLLSRSTSISAASANSAMLRRIASGTGPGLLLLGAMAAFDYYFDAGTKQMLKNGTDYTDFNCFYGASAKSISACKSLINQTTCKITTTYQVANSCQVNARRSGCSTIGLGTLTPSSCPNVSVDTDIDTGGPLSEAEMTAFRESQGSKVTPKQILEDAGVADRQVPEIAAQLDDMENDYKAATDTNADGSPNTATQPTVGTIPGDVGLDNAIAPDAVDTPTDCDKYPSALGCIDKSVLLDDFVDPGPQELAAKDVAIDFTPTISSSGSCPAPAVISYTGKSVSISYQPLCDFATTIRPIIITLAYLSAAMIVIGAREQSL